MKRVCQPLRCSVVAVALALIAPAAFAQLEINSSPSPVGSGARALGMGGAFIAIADDATAASWNPGGLTQLERPELSLVYNYKWLGEDFDSGGHPELSGSHDVDFNDINYFSFVYPIRRTIAGRNLVLSLNYQRKYDFDRDLDINYREINASNGGSAIVPGLGLVTFPGGNIPSNRQRVHFRQRGALSTISPAFGIELTDKLSVGVVYNIWDQSLIPDNEWKVRIDRRVTGRANGVISPISFNHTTVEEDYQDFRGRNWTIGALYKPNERWSIGAVYNTKFSADVTFIERMDPDISRLPSRRIAFRARRDQEYTFPSSFGLGVAYRFPNDKLTLSLDVTRVEWNQFEIRDPENLDWRLRRINGITGQPQMDSPDIDATYTVRLGGEYVFVDDKKPVQNYLPSLRAGIFYDPAPASNPKDTPFSNSQYGLGKGDGKPDDYFGFSVGAGVLIRDRINLDAAYSFRWGNDVRKDTFALRDTDADVRQHVLYFSTVIYF